jgi:hypothetical protein
MRKLYAVRIAANVRRITDPGTRFSARHTKAAACGIHISVVKGVMDGHCNRALSRREEVLRMTMKITEMVVAPCSQSLLSAVPDEFISLH